MDINFGIWSLIPPILAVALAFLTKNVILSLFVSLFSGCLILAYGNPWTALQTTFSDYLFVDMTSGSNAQTIVLMAVIGGFVALVEKSGGARAFARAISNKLTKPVSAQLACWLGGLAIYFSDSGNSLPIFRPVFDKLKVSRAKLSYILDSTSSPVCILIPITGWGVYVMNIIATQYEAIGIEGSDAGTFMQAIPYQFYAILALILIPVIALSKKNFGPMAHSEQLALKGLTEEQMKSEDVIVVEDDKEVSMWNMLLPLIVLFIVIFAMFIGWGWPTHNIAGSKIRIALTSGYLLAAITCLIMIVKQKLMTFQQAFDIFVGGIQKMGSILAVIVVAWGVGSVCGTLGTSTFIVESTTGTLSPALVPGLLFVIGAVISFAHRHQHGIQLRPGFPAGHRGRPQRQPVRRPLLPHLRHHHHVLHGGGLQPHRACKDPAALRTGSRGRLLHHLSDRGLRRHERRHRAAYRHRRGAGAVLPVLQAVRKKGRLTRKYTFESNGTI